MKETILREQYGPAEIKHNNYINTKQEPSITLKETMLREQFGDAQFNNNNYINTKEQPYIT